MTSVTGLLIFRIIIYKSTIQIRCNNENGIWIKTPNFILKAMLFLRYCYESVSKRR
jgi:hypothetical protein